jgi:hypothetical protein
VHKGRCRQWKWGTVRQMLSSFHCLLTLTSNTHLQIMGLVNCLPTVDFKGSLDFQRPLAIIRHEMEMFWISKYTNPNSYFVALDFKDVIFQRSPFAGLNRIRQPHLMLFKEGGPGITNGEQWWNKQSERNITTNYLVQCLMWSFVPRSRQVLGRHTSCRGRCCGQKNCNLQWFNSRQPGRLRAVLSKTL